MSARRGCSSKHNRKQESAILYDGHSAELISALSFSRFTRSKKRRKMDEAELAGYLGPSFFEELIGFMNPSTAEEDDDRDAYDEAVDEGTIAVEEARERSADMECVYIVPPEFSTSKYMEDGEEREKKRRRQGEEAEKEKAKDNGDKDNVREKAERSCGDYQSPGSVAREIQQNRFLSSSAGQAASNYLDRDAVDRLVAAAEMKKLEKEREGSARTGNETKNEKEKEKEGGEGEKRQRAGSALRTAQALLNTPSNEMETESGRFYLPLHASRKEKSSSWNER